MIVGVGNPPAYAASEFESRVRSDLSGLDDASEKDRGWTVSMDEDGKTRVFLCVVGFIVDVSSPLKQGYGSDEAQMMLGLGRVSFSVRLGCWA